MLDRDGCPQLGEREPVANDEHLGLLRQGTAAWNEWRERNPDQKPDLSEAILSAVVKGATLREVDQPRADLSWVNLPEWTSELRTLPGRTSAARTFAQPIFAGQTSAGHD